MNVRILACALVFSAVLAASDPVAAGLARQARQAQDSGQIVRAYLLYAEAAARDPGNPSYRANRDALAPAAKLLSKAKIETADVRPDISAAEQSTETGPPIEFATKQDWQRDGDLQPLPKLRPNPLAATFDIRGDEKSAFEQVAAAYGIRPIFDPQLDLHAPVRFQIDQADFRTAMEGLTAVTHTFVFPVSEHDLFVAQDSVTKRRELEPNVLLTVPLPNALGQKDLIEAASAVRTVLDMRTMGWDSESRTVLIRDRYTRASVARDLLNALLLPRAQVSVEVQFLTFDSDRSFHYGVSLPTAYQLVDFGHIGGLQRLLPSLANPPTFLAFGGGATLFGVGLTNASVFAGYSKSFSSNLYDATVVVGDGQTADFHIGDKYPIAQSIYTGFSQGGSSIYNPAPQITLEDLGFVLKITPHVNGEGDISLDIEADVKSLGSQSINSVPEIAERQYKGSVSLREGEWAVLAGMDSYTHSVSKTGLAGTLQIPGLNEVLAETTRDNQVSKTMLVIKPRITRLPMPGSASPEYLIGPQQGDRVLM